MGSPSWSSLFFARQYRNKVKQREPKSIVGFDTETVKGQAFLVCSSDFAAIHPQTPEQMFWCLFSHSLRKTLNLLWNIDYDFYAMAKFLPKSNLRDLASIGRTTYKDYTIKWIPHKMFSIRQHKNTVAFYDLWQFYKMSLEKAASTCLNMHKNEIDVTRFDDDTFREQHMSEIEEYCTQDAKLVKMLGERIQKQFASIGLDFNKPISPGYMSQRYFRAQCNIPVIKSKEPHYYAYKSYHGGRFEVFQRGYFDRMYVTDINSAYPNIISQLYDLNKGYWIKDHKVHEDALFGFMHVIAHTFDNPIQPLPHAIKGLICYPKMNYVEDYITIHEYDMCNKYNLAEFDVLDGIYWYPHELIRPFKVMQDLYDKRLELKYNKDPIESIIKIVMNSLYGKFYQKTPSFIKSAEPVGTGIPYLCYSKEGIGSYWKVFKTGSLFNPVYAAVITSEVRLQLLKTMLLKPESIISTFTDSIFSTQPVTIDSKALGEWSLKGPYEALVLGNGVYTYRNTEGFTTRFRGFKNVYNIDMFDMLNEHKNEQSIIIPQKHVITLKESLRNTTKWDETDINKFIDMVRELNINFDTKRNWERNFIDCYDAMSNAMASVPLVVAASS